MDQLLQAVTNLINTGGALADDALYLYFVSKIVGTAVIPVTVYALIIGVRSCIQTGLTYGAKASREAAEAHYAKYILENTSTSNTKWARERIERLDQRQ